MKKVNKGILGQAIAILLIGIAISASGCSGSKGVSLTTEQPAPKRLLVIGVDNSGWLYNQPNSPAVKAKYLRGPIHILVNGQQGTTLVKMVRFGTTADSIYNATPRVDDELFRQAVKREVVNSGPEKDKSSQKILEGTFYALILDRMSRECDDNPNLEVHGLIDSDGAADDGKAATAAAQRLVAKKNFKGLLVVPVLNGKLRSKIEGILAPLGDKVVVRGLEDWQDALEVFSKNMVKVEEKQ